MPKIKIALIGVGNCASALVQGLQYYKDSENKEVEGLRHPVLGGFSSGDIEVVAAFDVDQRKVGKDLAEAVFSKPNNAPKVCEVPSLGVVVQKGHLLDGVGETVLDVIQISKDAEVDVSKVLVDSEAEVVVNLLPSGATMASQYYAEQALKAGCGFINATPTSIASDPNWAKKYYEAGLPLAGDDLVDQVGSTALHKTLLNLLAKNGVKINETYQLDVGGGTESLDTMDRTRDLKRKIKTQAVSSALPYKTDVVAGSTDYVDFLENNRDSYFYITGTYFCNAPMIIDLKFSTVDAPNAGSVLFDVIRAEKIALNKKIGGSIESICSYGFKHPPKIVSLSAAEETFQRFVSQKS